MISVFQDDDDGCGIACVAMLCGVNYKKAKALCGDAYVQGDGVDVKLMRQILANQGFRVVHEGRITRDSLVTALRRHALLWGQQLPSRGKIVRHKNVHNHWTVWDADVCAVRDPDRYRKPIRLTKYFELEAWS